MEKAVEKIESHEKSALHLESVCQMALTKLRLESKKAVDREQVFYHQQLVANNRQILRRLLTIIVLLFLAQQNLPLRGHTEY